MRFRFQLLLIAALVLLVYYPAIFAEFNQVDDLTAVDAVRALSPTLKGIFVPGGGGGLYYRPLLLLSLILDKYLWSLDSSFMHLENILMHLGNALLVLLLSRELLPPEQRVKSLVPLVCSLLFALHPVNVESVAWVSGRTDPLAALFVLSSAIALLRFVRGGARWLLFAAAALLFLGCITKESAIGFLLGFALLLLAKPEEHPDGAGHTGGLPRAARVLVMVAAVCGVAALFFLLRSVAYSSNKSNIGLTLTYWKVNPYYSVSIVLRCFAFYIKKLFWPFPLNFAIGAVDPVYDLFALPLVALAALIAWRRTYLSALFLGGVGLLAPAFVIAFGQIAWTPFSERYAYLASCFIIPATVHYLTGVCQRLQRDPLRLVYRNPGAGLAPGELAVGGKAVAAVLLAVALPVALAGTLQRVLVWRSNVALFADTARKSPDSIAVRDMYGVALYRQGDLKGAEREMALSASLYNFPYRECYDVNYALVLREQGKYAQAQEVCRKVVAKTQGKSALGWEEQALLLQARLQSAPAAEREGLRRELLQAGEKLYALKPPAEKLYLLGQIAAAADERALAAKCFQTASKGLGKESPFGTAASRLSRTMATTQEGKLVD